MDEAPLLRRHCELNLVPLVASNQMLQMKTNMTSLPILQQSICFTQFTADHRTAIALFKLFLAVSWMIDMDHIVP